MSWIAVFKRLKPPKLSNKKRFLSFLEGQAGSLLIKSLLLLTLVLENTYLWLCHITWCVWPVSAHVTPLKGISVSPENSCRLGI